MRLTYLDAGNMFLQFVEPLDGDSPLTRWLEEHGEGLHHLCFGVDDVATAVGALSDRASPLCSGTAAAASRASSAAGSHGVRIECTEFDRATDVDASPGFLPGEQASTDSQPNDPFGRKGTMRCVSTYEHHGRTGVGIAGDGGVAPTAYDDMAALIRDGATRSRPGTRSTRTGSSCPFDRARSSAAASTTAPTARRPPGPRGRQDPYFFAKLPTAVAGPV